MIYIKLSLCNLVSYFHSKLNSKSVRRRKQFLYTDIYSFSRNQGDLHWALSKKLEI